VSSFTVPGNTSVPRTYRVIAVADALNQQPELDETNNLAVSPPVARTAYQPDLAITALSVPGTVQVGGKLAIAHTVRNAGPAPAGAFAIRFYLSSDDALDAGDVLFGTRNVAGLGAGASSPAVSTFTIASTLPPAGYRVMAVADALAAGRAGRGRQRSGLGGLDRFSLTRRPGLARAADKRLLESARAIATA